MKALFFVEGAHVSENYEMYLPIKETVSLEAIKCIPNFASLKPITAHFGR